MIIVKFLSFKRVPKFFSGLFVLFAINFCLAEGNYSPNFEITGKGGNLLHWEGKNISFWDNKILYRNNVLENEVNFLKIDSDVRWFSTEFYKLSYFAKFDFNVIKPKITAGLLKSQEIEILSGNTKITNDGAKGFYVGSDIGFNIQNFEITPSFLFANGKFDRGDFQFFYGKPDIPKFLHFALSIEYEKTHNLTFSYKNFDLNVINNIYMPLFQSDTHIFAGNYKYSLFISEKLREFSAVLGFAYADFSADGALTSANQQYVLFPYTFYNICGNANAFVAWTGASLEIQRKHLKHLLKIGAANTFSGKINADYHYRYKPFYQRRRGYEGAEKSIDEIKLSGTGLGFTSYALESPSLTIKNKVNIYFGTQKIFIAPWGLNKFSADEESNIFENFDRKNLLKTILLSGLSGNLRITF